MKKTLIILANISTLIGIFGFIIPFLKIEDLHFTLLQKVFLGIIIIVCISYIIYELCSSPKKYKNEDEINKYMRDWVKKTGRTVIFTRDMSWANNQQIQNDLINKARSNDLIICLPKITSFTQRLKNEGAEIYTYDTLNFTPKSRFTFINYGSNSSKVAIGRKDDKHNHIITEYTTKDTIEYFLAEDLVNIIKNLP
ncbi:hypothetical protein GCM10023210_43580 [Chryseobacterium ginsengisoli]|uniref:Uncharacterized protein n=1 Tax=Chryseobacterium ginsengisoli TaxID=363853 RepID=A0ABP9MVY5_9FLAO